AAPRRRTAGPGCRGTPAPAPQSPGARSPRARSRSPSRRSGRAAATVSRPQPRYDLPSRTLWVPGPSQERLRSLAGPAARNVLLAAAEHVYQELPARPVERLHQRQYGLAMPAVLRAKRNERLVIDPDNWTLTIRFPLDGVETHRAPTVAPLSERNEA